jgi:DNA primase
MADLLELLNKDTQLRRVASTNGGEWAGPCPWCGGTDRFRVWPYAARPRYWCRQCGRSGDAIQYLRDRYGLSFREACEKLGLEPREPGISAPELRPRAQPLSAPPARWQERAKAFIQESEAALWSVQGGRALAWLHSRGLRDETIKGACLGYNPTDRRERGELWAVQRDVWLPRGIVIPWEVEGKLWALSTRRPAGEPKYLTVSGSSNALYGADQLRAGRAAVLVEGVFDALAVKQATGDLAAAVACGTGGARHPRWIAKLALCSVVLVAFDADQAGESASEWWLSVLRNAKRWRPYFDDPAALAAAGMDLRFWVALGLGDKCSSPCAACSIAEFCRFLSSLGAVPQCRTGNNQKQLAAAG